MSSRGVGIFPALWILACLVGVWVFVDTSMSSRGVGIFPALWIPACLVGVWVFVDTSMSSRGVGIFLRFLLITGVWIQLIVYA